MDTMTAVVLVLTIAEEHKDVDILKDILHFNKDDIQAAELQTSNNMWQIKFGSKSFILKQGCNVTKVGSQEGACFEYESLDAHHQLCPGFVPQPYCWSVSHKAVLLEDCGDYAVLSDEITASRVDLAGIKKFGANLGILHKLSHSAANSVVVRDLMKKFSNNPLVERMAETTFADPFDAQHIEGQTNEVIKQELTKLASNKNMMDKVASLKNTVLHRKECLSHAFMSTASIGVKDGDVKLINGFDGTFMGPCSFDVASVLADYLAFYHQHMLTEIDNDAHRQVSYKMVEACTETVDAYLEQMTVSVDNREQYVSRLISEIAGFCGIQLIARVAHGTFDDREALSKGIETLQSGVRLLDAAHRINSANFLTVIALMLTH